ncbi:hypothetical protein H4Q26_011246 [Puccinia striiformis f. sp. tritici PST-130]|nr:hypothetical protein H4Q26_011246 [Puccinia striiformis f. sp. tritici PST-130]
MNLLHTSFGRINISQSKNGEELSSRPAMGLPHRISGVKSPLSTSTSLADLSEGLAADVEAELRDGNLQVRSSDIQWRFSSFPGPASAAAFVPPIGHSLSRNINDPFSFQEKIPIVAGHNTAAPGIGASAWVTQKERLIGESQSRQQSGEWGSLPQSPSSQLQTATNSVPNLPHQIHQQILLNQQLQQLQQLQVQQHQLQQQQTQLLNSTMRLPSNAFTYSNMSPSAPGAFFGNGGNPHIGPTPPNPSRLQTTITGLPGLGSLSGTSHTSPDIRWWLGADDWTKYEYAQADALHGSQPSWPTRLKQPEHSRARSPEGLQSNHFDTSPPSARFFVIKSYTEEDVHKSLKYEIWASTDLGNKRLDRAFHESHESGPSIFVQCQCQDDLIFSCSGHFCGMAEMLTAVDYNTTSKVWAQDKWKGIFKVRWVFVKDVPNNALRHIKLTNTPENKPITSSRDTQEVPHDKGIQVLHIMSSYQSRTTLLQDYAWYEHNESQKSQQQQATESGTGLVSASATPLNSHNQNQNVRRFTQANGYPGQYAPVTVQVASGI